MTTQTNLNAIYDVANALLDTEVKIDEVWDRVEHPFFTGIYDSSLKLNDAGPYILRFKMRTSKVDIRVGNNVERVKEFYREVFKKTQRYIDYINIVNKPYLPLFFELTEKYLSVEDFSHFLAVMWKTVEFTNASLYITCEKFVEYFKRADINFMISKEEVEKFNSLPDEVVIYRGVNSNGSVRALSWTLSKDTAKWFADRFRKNGNVFKAKIKKEHICAYFEHEEEVIVDFNMLYDIKKIG